ncbi:RNA polymerase sigma factor [Steroidobacter sp. S1-65]|uniref:RNA polymerase sigma factor n=1 Tax=Steroidobacter gossypii TaxID=2805490 RepID=A0ABS1WQJ7_9GAMM|nr:RNA polymerase sigma factor [Steroidobacter gossypii]MBM0103249.1 RNA polymerase sigma factor [Steroidobacter gossypii]
MGDDAISDEFVRRHYAGLQSLLRRKIGDPAIAADLLNEAVATAMSHSRDGRVEQPERMAGYVYRVALNLYRNHRREFANRPDLRAGPEDIHRIPDRDGESEPVDLGLLQRVRTLIGELPTPRDREIVKRYYLDEEEKESICQALELSPLHFDRVIFRARQRLRTLLESKGYVKSDFFNVLLVCLA